MKLVTTVFALTALAWLAPVAVVHADDDEYGEELHLDGEQPPAPALITLSFSPLHLFLPMFEGQADLRLGPLFSLSVLGGGGQVDVKTSEGKQLSFGAYELGGQVTVYPMDVFQGLEFGAEVLWLHVSLDPTMLGDARIAGLGAGLATGPFLGYKWIAPMGFTVFVQGGFEVLVSHAKAHNDLGQNASVHDSDLLLMLNFNIGWSF